MNGASWSGQYTGGLARAVSQIGRPQPLVQVVCVLVCRTIGTSYCHARRTGLCDNIMWTTGIMYLDYTFVRQYEHIGLVQSIDLQDCGMVHDQLATPGVTTCLTGTTRMEFNRPPDAHGSHWSVKKTLSSSQDAGCYKKSFVQIMSRETHLKRALNRTSNNTQLYYI